MCVGGGVYFADDSGCRRVPLGRQCRLSAVESRYVRSMCITFKEPQPSNVAHREAAHCTGIHQQNHTACGTARDVAVSMDLYPSVSLTAKLGDLSF